MDSRFEFSAPGTPEQMVWWKERLLHFMAEYEQC